MKMPAQYLATAKMENSLLRNIRKVIEHRTANIVMPLLSRDTTKVYKSIHSMKKKVRDSFFFFYNTRTQEPPMNCGVNNRLRAGKRKHFFI